MVIYLKSQGYSKLLHWDLMYCLILLHLQVFIFFLLTVLEEANLYSIYMLFSPVRCQLSCFYGSIIPENDIALLSIALILKSIKEIVWGEILYNSKYAINRNEGKLKKKSWIYLVKLFSSVTFLKNKSNQFHESQSHSWVTHVPLLSHLRQSLCAS